MRIHQALIRKDDSKTMLECKVRGDIRMHEVVCKALQGFGSVDESATVCEDQNRPAAVDDARAWRGVEAQLLAFYRAIAVRFSGHGTDGFGVLGDERSVYA